VKKQEKKHPEKTEKSKQARFLFHKEDTKERQLLEAIQNRAILEPLEDQGLSLGELQNKLSQMKEEHIEKSTLANRISRLRTAGLVRKQTKQINEAEVRSPEYRGWRIHQTENGAYQAELGFELTTNGKDALKAIRNFTQENEAPPQDEEEEKDRKKDEEKNE
jgi:DNA-binding HxlR family transcriptional regulator